MQTGRILWDELALHYQRGFDWTRTTRKDWDALASASFPFVIELMCAEHADVHFLARFLSREISISYAAPQGN